MKKNAMHDLGMRMTYKLADMRFIDEPGIAERVHMCAETGAPFKDEGCLQITFYVKETEEPVAFASLSLSEFKPRQNFGIMVHWADCEDGELYAMLRSCELSDEFRKTYIPGYDNVLRGTKYVFCLVDILYIRPEYRNLGIGTFTLENLDRLVYRGCGKEIGCSALVPVPLEPNIDFSSNVSIDIFEKTPMTCSPVYPDGGWAWTNDDEMRYFMTDFAESQGYKASKANFRDSYLFRSHREYEGSLDEYLEPAKTIEYYPVLEDGDPDANDPFMTTFTIDVADGMTWEDWLESSLSTIWDYDETSDLVYSMDRDYPFCIYAEDLSQPIDGYEESYKYDPVGFFGDEDEEE